jgi:hypothetical protein
VVPEKETLILRRATVDEVAPLIGKAARYNTDDEPFVAVQVAAQGDRFVIERGGRAVFGLVLEARDDEVFIVAAGAECGRLDFTRIGLGAVEAMARRHFKAVAFATRRGGLIKKAQRLGYAVQEVTPGGKILRKEIK